MNFLQHLSPGHRGGRRIGAALVLLLLLGMSIGLSLLQSRQQAVHLAVLTQGTQPSVRLLRELSAQVDELRGMLALHLMLNGTAEATTLESRMASARVRIEQQLVGFEARLGDTVERGHFDAVRVSLGVFLVEQERLLVISRQAARDAALAAQARRLLIGASQQAYQALTTDLTAWWTYVEQQTDRAIQRAQAAAGGLMPVQLGLLAIGLLVALLGGQRRRSGDGLQALAEMVDQIAIQSHLLALNVAVESARAGPLGIELAGVADAARSLAERSAVAAREAQQQVQPVTG